MPQTISGITFPPGLTTADSSNDEIWWLGEPNGKARAFFCWHLGIPLQFWNRDRGVCSDTWIATDTANTENIFKRMSDLSHLYIRIAPHAD